jgi:hypothetical protein
LGINRAELFFALGFTTKITLARQIVTFDENVSDEGK